MIALLIVVLLTVVATGVLLRKHFDERLNTLESRLYTMKTDLRRVGDILEVRRGELQKTTKDGG